MPRQPDLKNKTNRLVYVPSDCSENKLAMDAKALCIQDGITIRDLLSEALTLVFKVHHWPPGNPQLTLQTSLELSEKVRVRCKCGSLAVKHGVFISSGKEFDFCVKCFSVLPQRHDPKVWKITCFLPSSNAVY